ncbi:MAG: inositol monophosphatase [Alphaproteobacteria bacterium]|nr:MAG: inositol monophosphatase [Alphaproteobacteria bacterium]
MPVRSALMTVMARAAEKAGKSLVRDFGEVENLQVSKKGPKDFVSNADERSEKILREELAKARPDFSFLGEESGKHVGTGGEDAPCWIVDPLDGTTNFLHGLPHWCISIALQRHGEIMAGLVFDPVQDEMFWAERGHGAYMNHRRLRVSARKELGLALIHLSHNPARTPEDKTEWDIFLREMAELEPMVAGNRRMGSAALALSYVAAGRLDACVMRHFSIWDVAAARLIAIESGAALASLVERNHPIYDTSILASTPGLFSQIQRRLRSVRTKTESSAS